MNVHGEGRGSDAYLISGGRALQPNPGPARKYIVDGTPESLIECIVERKRPIGYTN
jgi:hypothetical protein